MDKKPELIVKLMAGDTVIDQSTDVALWQRVLAEIRGVASASPQHSQAGQHVDEVQSGKQDADAPIKAFAKELGITVDELEGGLGPEIEAPFITLDDRSWETLKKHTPKRGPGGVSAATLAATALALWQRHAQTFDVTIQTVRATLETIHLDDANASRSISNCAWLQEKGGRIVPHPARKSGGIRLLRSYCKGEPPPEAA